MIDVRSFRDIVRLFFIFKSEFKITVIITVIVALLGAFFLPLKFISEAKLLVKPGRENTTLPIEAGNRQALIAPTTVRDPIVDEEKMLQGDPIARRVAERYITLMAEGVSPSDGFKSTVKGGIKGGLDSVRVGLINVGLVDKKSAVEKIAKILKKNFKVSHASGSSVMEISFTWGDPEVAQKVVEYWLEVYLEERTAALSSSSSLYDFYNKAKNESAAQLSDLQIKLNEKLADIDAADYDNRFTDLTSRLNDARKSRSDAKIALGALEAGLVDAVALKEALPPVVIKNRQLGLNPNKVDLNKQLNLLRIERLELLRTFHEDAEPVVEIDKSIEALNDRIDLESDRILQTENRAPNTSIENLDKQIISKKILIAENKELIEEYDEEISRLSSSLDKLLSDKSEIMRLNVELEAVSKNYALYLDNFEKARIDKELDEDKISNMAIIEQPSLNNERIFPKSLNIILMAGPLAIVIGLFVLYLCFLFDRRIHDGGRVEDYFSTKLWTTLRDMKGQDTEVDSEFQASLYRIYNLLPLDTVAEKGFTVGLTSSREGEGVRFIAEKLRLILQQEGMEVVDSIKQHRVKPGQIRIVEAPSISSNSAALIKLKSSDVMVLVIEAARTTVPMVEHSLSILNTAFNKVDGIILNRRVFEIPPKWWRYFSPKY